MEKLINLTTTVRRIFIRAARQAKASMAAAMPLLSRFVRSPSVRRVALAGPGAVAATMLVILGMPLWLPQGPAEIDQIAFPLVLMPLVWAALFFHACLDRSLRRATAVALALCFLNGGAIVWHFAASRSHPPTEATQ